VPCLSQPWGALPISAVGFSFVRVWVLVLVPVTLTMVA